MLPLSKPTTAWDPASESLSEALNLSLKILKVIMAILVLLFIASGVFMVEQHEVALILRFGKVQGNMGDRVLKPGLHWTWPYPLSEIVRVPVGRAHTLAISDFTYRGQSVEEEKRFKEKLPDTLDPESDGYCLTGDANIIHCQWQVRYTISDPFWYLVKTAAPNALLEHIVNHAIVEVMAKLPAHEVLGRSDELRRSVQLKAQEKLVSLDIGLEIQGTDIVLMVPARQARDAFESVVRAEREAEKRIEEARNYKTQLLNKAKGEYASIVAQARNYQLEIVKEAESDARYFEQLLAEYAKHPEILKEHHYQRVMSLLHDKVQELFLLNRRDQRELRLQTNRNPELYRVKPQVNED